MSPAHFLIYSRGRTATQWIAQALSSVPGVMCSHGYDPEPYAAGGDKLLRTRLAMHYGLPSVDAYFDMLETKPFAAYGNIHGFDAVKLATWPGNRRRFRTAQITRHPFARILSFAAKWAQPDHAGDAGVAVAPYDQRRPERDRLIMAATDLVLASDAAHLLEPVRIFRSEDVTTSAPSFAALAHHVADIWPSASVIRRILRTQAADKLTDVSLADGFDALSNSAHHYLRQRFRPYPALCAKYEALGYDLSFLDIGAPCVEADTRSQFAGAFTDD